MSDTADATGTVESFPALQDEKTVTWGDAQFTVNKMLPMEAKALFVEHVQPLMHQVMRLLDEVQGDGEDEDTQFVVSDTVLGKRMMKRAAMIFSALPPKHYRSISLGMSKSISGPARRRNPVPRGQRGMGVPRTRGCACHHAGRTGVSHKFYRVAARRALGVSVPDAGFRVAQPKNVDPFFGNLVAAEQFGLTFEHFETRRSDGEPKIDLARCCDYHEILIVRAANEHRAHKAASKHKRGGKRGKRG